MKKTFILMTLSIGACLTAPGIASAHGFEGDRFFPPTIQTDDPFATDELALPVITYNPASASRELDVYGEFDKEIFPKFSLGISGTYINQNPEGGPSVDGFDNVSLSAKYQLWENAPHEFIFSVGGEIDLGGTGSHSLAESFSTYTPTIYFGKGFGDLPSELKYARPLALTGTLGYAIPGEAVDPNAVEWGLALEYSLPYLQEHVEDVGIPHPFKDMIPLVEFSMNSPVNREGGTTTGTVNPGVLWESKYCQIGAEAVIPVNSHTGPAVGAVFQVQIFIDDVWPSIFGHPLFGGDK